MTDVTRYKNVDIEVEIDLSDVNEFISEASRSELDDIAQTLASRGVNCGLSALDAATVIHLIERANQFGIADMLDELKREGERVGVFLKVDAYINSPHASPLQGA